MGHCPQARNREAFVQENEMSGQVIVVQALFLSKQILYMCINRQTLLIFYIFYYTFVFPVSIPLRQCYNVLHQIRVQEADTWPSPGREAGWWLRWPWGSE